MTEISAFPTKRFFVEMLVRDIELKDAILDLLDNCVDGAMRSISRKSREPKENPYEGFWAKIEFSENEFSIQDNCGGIPRDIAIKSAFKLGRPEPTEEEDADGGELPTVGVYGIGMKRAIFKIGRNAIVSSYHDNTAFDVAIDPEWMEKDVWTLDLQDREPLPNEHYGTHIIVNDIRPGVAQEFATDAFFDLFCDAVSEYYSIIIPKGFKVYVNGKDIKPKKIGFILDEANLENGIAPYIYLKDPAADNVEVTLAVGFYRRLLSEEESEQQEAQEREGHRPSSEIAGWTVVINDRVVLYADKTRVTGWDDAGVPGYHTQFTSIAGIVEFRSNSPELLPLTTTKRGVNGNSDLYLSVKNYMREGLKLFTNFTNQWKKSPEQRDQLRDDAKEVSLNEAVKLVANRMRASRRDKGASIFTPTLPTPKPTSVEKWIRYKRPAKDVEFLALHFFDDVDTKPSSIGEKTFDLALLEAKKEGGK
jgi:Histidine kinase-, DNA gyrase B-, and HSP90-like ATPase